MNRVLIVANRLPVHLAKTDEGYRTEKSVSGLSTAMDSVLRDSNGLYIGWAGDTQEVCQENKEVINSWESDGYIAVDIPTDVLTSAHENFNNQVLWALFHNFPNYMNYRDSDWNCYVQFNEIFAKRVIELYKEGDIIWIQDFQLMLLPKMLREALPKANIKFFLHISFPTSDVFQYLPRGREILEGVLASDLLQFHTDSHVKNFLRSMNRLGVENNNFATIEANPIGMDSSLFKTVLLNSNRQEKSEWIKKAFKGKKIILATERLDYTKGIIERVKAFEYLLDNYPEWRGKVVLVQVAVHSRINVPIYQTIGSEVDQAIGKLNGKYGTIDYTPIHYSNKSWRQEDLAVLYSVSDVACVTPLIDGMNLVSKEFVISEDTFYGVKDRVLILSKFAGSAIELKDALLVNPYHIEEVGKTMELALRCPDELKGMMQTLQEVVQSNTVVDWTKRALERS